MERGELWLVRHGETPWSAAGRHTGRTDVALSDTGRAQAESLRPLLAERRFALVLTSPMQRAVQTCQLAGFADRAATDADLREWDYGDYEGRTTAEIRAERPGWTVWLDGCPHGESAASVAERADRVVQRARAAGGDVLAFTHGHMSRVIAARWLDLPVTDGALLGFDAACVGVLGWEREQAVVRRWNLAPR